MVDFPIPAAQSSQHYVATPDSLCEYYFARHQYVPAPPVFAHYSNQVFQRHSRGLFLLLTACSEIFVHSYVLLLTLASNETSADVVCDLHMLCIGDSEIPVSLLRV